MPQARTRTAQKSPRAAGLFDMIGASTEVLGTTAAGDLPHNLMQRYV